MTTNQPLTQTEGQKVMFWLDDRYVVGEILRSTPSTQTVYYYRCTYDVHYTKLTPVFFSEALGRRSVRQRQAQSLQVRIPGPNLRLDSRNLPAATTESRSACAKRGGSVSSPFVAMSCISLSLVV